MRSVIDYMTRVGMQGRDVGSWQPQSADEQSAYVAQQEYNTYIDTFRPVEDYLFQQLASWNDISMAAENDNMRTVSKSFEQAQGAFDRDTKSYGIQMTPEQRQSIRRNFDIQAAKSAVEAGNRTRRQMEDMKYQIGFGVSPYGMRGRG